VLRRILPREWQEAGVLRFELGKSILTCVHVAEKVIVIIEKICMSR